MNDAKATTDAVPASTDLRGTLDQWANTPGPDGREPWRAHRDRDRDLAAADYERSMKN